MVLVLIYWSFYRLAFFEYWITVPFVVMDRQLDFNALHFAYKALFLDSSQLVLTSKQPFSHFYMVEAVV